MHVIPSLIPEAVLGTKEPSEKARLAAFDLIVAMGRKMNEGGVVKRSMMDGMDEDSPSEGSWCFSALGLGPEHIYSYRKCRGVYDDGCWRPSGRHSTHDQCDCHRDITACV
jgi:hypothetical protein